MKGNKKVIDTLNDLLADELTVINQYMVHSEICENWNYDKLHQAIRKQAFDEMNHAEWLIERIIFLEGTPTVSNLRKINIGKNVKEIILNDYDYELEAVEKYNKGMRVAREQADNGTRDLLEKILKAEEDHVDWAEAQRDQIEQMGLQNYILGQIGKVAE